MLCLHPDSLILTPTFATCSGHSLTLWLIHLISLCSAHSLTHPYAYLPCSAHFLTLIILSLHAHLTPWLPDSYTYFPSILSYLPDSLTHPSTFPPCSAHSLFPWLIHLLLFHSLLSPWFPDSPIYFSSILCLFPHTHKFKIIHSHYDLRKYQI